MFGPYARVYEAKQRLADRRVEGDLARLKDGRAVLRVAPAAAQDARRFLCAQSSCDDHIISAEEAPGFDCAECREPIDPMMVRCSRCGAATADRLAP